MTLHEQVEALERRCAENANAIDEGGYLTERELYREFDDALRALLTASKPSREGLREKVADMIYDTFGWTGSWKNAALLASHILALVHPEEGLQEALLKEVADCAQCDLCQDHFIIVHNRKAQVALSPSPAREAKDVSCPEWPELVGPSHGYGPESAPPAKRYRCYDCHFFCADEAGANAHHAMTGHDVGDGGLAVEEEEA